MERLKYFVEKAESLDYNECKFTTEGNYII